MATKSITDDQIRDLRRIAGERVVGDLRVSFNAAWAWPTYARNGATVADVCTLALGEITPMHLHQLSDLGSCMPSCGACYNIRDARRRCTEILNAHDLGRSMRP